MRRHERASVCDRGDIAHDLYRRHLESVLADHGVIRIADAPRVAVEDFFLPLGRRDRPFLFAAKNDAGEGAEAESARILIDLLNTQALLRAESAADFVEIDVGRNGDRMAQIHFAVRLPVFKNRWMRSV